ncbi:hypothetical protein [Brevibacillus sp. SYSU BS000544]|uniref:hypothetical protein n=1 Tax=Brevibacillus sp. SYSU BS000544 TaxID=3416443 RepID=UPI003CE4DD59
MSKPFEPFATDLNFLQLSLLLDTVSYFEEAPKLISLPSESGAVAVPLLSDTLRVMLGHGNEESPTDKRPYSFRFEWTDEAQKKGTVIVTLPSSEELKQETDLSLFSAI